MHMSCVRFLEYVKKLHCSGSKSVFSRVLKPAVRWLLLWKNVLCKRSSCTGPRRPLHAQQHKAAHSGPFVRLSSRKTHLTSPSPTQNPNSPTHHQPKPVQVCPEVRRLGEVRALWRVCVCGGEGDERWEGEQSQTSHSNRPVYILNPCNALKGCIHILHIKQS